MNASIGKRAAVWSVALLMGLAACSAPSEPLKIAQVDLTHEIDEHNEPRSARETFAPTSTIYASIAVEGSGKGTLAAKWTDPSGQVLADQHQDINNTKPTRYDLLPDPNARVPSRCAHPLRKRRSRV